MWRLVKKAACFVLHGSAQSGVSRCAVCVYVCQVHVSG